MGEKLDLAALRRQAEEDRDEQRELQHAAEKPSPVTVKREITLRIVYPTPGTGELLEASVQSRVMTGDERRLAQRMEVMLADGMNVSSLSQHAQSRIRALAVCSTQLREPPKWLLTHIEEDDTLLFSVYGVLHEHDARYFFRDGGAGEGAQEARRLAVIAPFSTESSDQS